MQKIGNKITIHLTDEDLANLQKIADYHGMTRAEAHRAMLRLGYDIWSDFKFIGIPQLAEFKKRVKKAIREGFQPRLT